MAIEFEYEQVSDSRIKITKITKCLTKDQLDAAFIIGGVHAFATYGRPDRIDIHFGMDGDRYRTIVAVNPGFSPKRPDDQPSHLTSGLYFCVGSVMTLEALDLRIKYLKRAGNRLQRWNRGKRQEAELMEIEAHKARLVKVVI